MKLLDNNTPQVEFDNIHPLINAVMSNNKSEPVKVGGYGAIYANYKGANNFYIFRFTYSPFTLQKDVKSDVNQMVSSALVCNAIFTSPEWNTSRFYIEPY